MRPAIVTALVAVAFLAAIEVGLRTTDTIPDPVTWGSPYTQERAEALTALGDTDLVVLGSSIGGASIAAGDLTDGVGYNASLPAMAPRVWLAWYRDVVSGTDPEVVVIAADMRFFDSNDPGSARLLEEYLTSPGRLRHVEGPSLDDRVGDVWELYRLRSRLREPEKLVAALTGVGDVGDWRPIRLNADGQHPGFAAAEYDPSDDWLESLTRQYRDADWGGVEADALRTLIEESRADGAQVVLLITPAVWSEFSRALPHGMDDVAAYRSTIRSIGAEYDVPVLEYPVLDDDRALYADYYHMNHAGSEALTTALAADLEQLGLTG